MDERGEGEAGRPEQDSGNGKHSHSASYYALTGAHSVIKGIDEVLADRILVRFDNPEDEEMYHRTIAAVRMVLDAAADDFREKLTP